MAVPEDIAGLVLWLDASQLVGYNDGDTVTPYVDYSGNGYDLTQVGGGVGLYQTNEINGLPGVSFTAPTNYLRQSDSLPNVVNPFTIFYVARMDGAGNRAVTPHGGNNWLLGPYSGTWNWFSGGFASAGKAATVGQWIVHGVTQTAASGTHYVYELENETAAVTGTRANPTSMGPFGLGNASPNSEGFVGLIVEVVVYDNVISTPDQEALIAYFRYKWANVGTPPADPVPAAPTSLGATAISDTAIDLAWTDNAADETGFRVERSLDGVGSWSDVSGALAVDTVTYSDTGLTPETEYFYRVFAFNASGDSAPSNVDSATTQATPIPPPSSGNRMGGTGAVRKPPR